MSARDRFDLVVVGAGPAGSTAAYAAARRGLRVALVDQRTFPRDKTCGDGLGPGVAALLDELGLGHVLEGEVPARALAVYGPDGVLLDTDLPPMSGHGYVVPRLDFDDRLHTAALEGGAVDLSGHKLVATGLDGGRRWVTLRHRGRDHTVEAALVVGADGAYSAMRRQLGVAKNPERHLAVAMRAYAKSTMFDERPCLVFEFSRTLLPAYGWLFPTGQGVVNIGVGLMLPHLRQRHHDLRTLLDTFVASCRERGVELGEPAQHRAHHLPTAGWLPPLAHERAVLVGDAGSMINPVSGEGIVYGMRAANRLVTALPDDVHDEKTLRRALVRFERDFRRGHRAHILSSLAAHRLLSSPWWTKRVINAAQRDPHVLRDAIDLLFDLGRLRPSTTVRILRHGW
jgi:geranylgeranyl reductase family protein